MANDHFDGAVQFNEDKEVPKKLTLKDVEVLTKQDVIDMYEWGRRVVFVLGNGMKMHVEKW